MGGPRRFILTMPREDDTTKSYKPMSATNIEGGGPTPINLIDCGLEDLIAALLHGQPVAMPKGDAQFVLENDNARRILAYYTQRRDLWPRAKPVQTREIDEVLKGHCQRKQR